MLKVAPLARGTPSCNVPILGTYLNIAVLGTVSRPSRNNSSRQVRRCGARVLILEIFEPLLRLYGQFLAPGSSFRREGSNIGNIGTPRGLSLLVTVPRARFILPARGFSNTKGQPVKWSSQNLDNCVYSSYIFLYHSCIFLCRVHAQTYLRSFSFQRSFWLTSPRAPQIERFSLADIKADQDDLTPDTGNGPNFFEPAQQVSQPKQESVAQPPTKPTPTDVPNVSNDFPASVPNNWQPTMTTAEEIWRGR